MLMFQKFKRIDTNLFYSKNSKTKLNENLKIVIKMFKILKKYIIFYQLLFQR